MDIFVFFFLQQTDILQTNSVRLVFAGIEVIQFRFRRKNDRFEVTFRRKKNTALKDSLKER